MILTQLTINGFGRLHDRTIAFAPGLTVIAGPNEAGKTTLVECIVRLLFGYPDRQYKEDWGRFAPWGGGAHAAAIAYRLDDGREFETYREFRRADIATKTYDGTTGRVHTELCGSRSASPGATLLGLSLPAFEAAAVIRAAEFAFEPDADAHKLLAERLAAIVGAAGDASAVAAIDRLDKVITQLGGDSRATNSSITRARGETAAATHALEDYRREFASAETSLARRAALQDEIAHLNQRLERLNAQHVFARWSGVKDRLKRAADAEAAVARAQAGRDSIRASTAVAVAEPPDGIEAAVVEWRAAQEGELAAARRTAAAKSQKAEAERSFTDALRALGQANGKVTEISERIAALPDLSRYREIPESDLAQIEVLADRAAALEADADKQATIAAFSRQRRTRGSSAIAVLCAALGALATAVGAFTHFAALLYGGIGLLALGVILFVMWMARGQKQSAGVAASESTAENARERYQALAKDLASRCGALGCKDVFELREIYNGQQRASRMREQLDAAQRVAAQAEELRAARAAHLDEFANLDRQAQAAAETRQEREAQLQTLLDGAGVDPGSVAERVNAWREAAQSDKRFAQADAEVAKAKAARAAVLGDRSIEQWQAEEKRLAEEVRRLGALDLPLPTNGGAVDFASTTSELAEHIDHLQREIADKHKELSFVDGLLDDFQRRYPAGSSELEERLARALAAERRFTEARKAAELARDTIARLQTEIHRNFAPRLNQAISEAAGAVTGGRYTEVRVDPSDFSVRAITPERGVPAEELFLSSGTREQLFLALRAAVAQSLAPGERVPLILDDALAHADDARLPAAVAHLARMGERGQQILLFTQRGDVVRAARENGAAIVELDGPPSPSPATSGARA